MYDRFISSSMLTGIFCVRSAMVCWVRRALNAPASRLFFTGDQEARSFFFKRGISPNLLNSCSKSDIQIPHVERVVLDELSARLDLVAHQCRKHLIGFGVIFGAHLQ